MEFIHRRRPFVLEGYSADDHLYMVIVRTRNFYEADLLEYMRSLSLPRGLGIDIGANIGNHAVYFASFLADHVIAVEPNPAVLPLLRTNLQRNCANFTICDNALGEAPGRADIELPPGAERNMGMAKLDVSRASGRVEVTTLDALLRDCVYHRNMPVTFIKLDVEGMELAVLKGGINTITRDQPHLFLEVASDDAFARIRQFLAGFGYVPVVKWAYTPVYHFAYRPSLGLRLHASTVKGHTLLRRAMRAIRRGLRPRIKQEIVGGGLDSRVK